MVVYADRVYVKTILIPISIDTKVKSFLSAIRLLYFVDFQYALNFYFIKNHYTILSKTIKIKKTIPRYPFTVKKARSIFVKSFLTR